MPDERTSEQRARAIVSPCSAKCGRCGDCFAYTRITTAIDDAVRAETERCAQEADAMAKRCRSFGEHHFCDYFGCSSFTGLAATLRAPSSTTGGGERAERAPADGTG